MPNVTEMPNPIAMVPVNGSALETAPFAAHRRPRKEHLFPAGSLAASIVHDLRNPVATICGCAEMLLHDNPVPGKNRRIASNIHRAAGVLRDLLTDLARVTGGHEEVREKCNLRAILAASCRAAGVAERDDIEIQLYVPPRIEIWLERARMERVFLNLIVNALEAMPCGGTIRITAEEAGDFVAIEVEDTGTGIPIEIRHSLFEPFVTAGKDGGLGLGLAFSRHTVRDHGGELWTEPAAGARFVISLPRVQSRTA